MKKEQFRVEIRKKRNNEDLLQKRIYLFNKNQNKNSNLQ